ncbi:putative hydrolase yutF [Bhargavaea cecembensis DSE10]|uniref:Putative hydrolase yutF n=1 Tax=Bhargavaea cecembensis DSE10 TaxID=1235279 RepID=M7NCZ8_9BACL|nr:TIGR01457 family HAD-type hydrolase [Bhargavaea cecembensis]EMR05132.1 putative hydrolase yutF [Bhargavaea cecembensis DSE10]
MREYQAWCFDLDGTVYRGKEPIPETVRFIRGLREKGAGVFFVTNNSALTPEQQSEKLEGMGITAAPEEIMTSSVATAEHLLKNHGALPVSMIGEEGLRTALESAGHRIVRESPDAVVVGIDREITYGKLADASLAVSAGALFVATNSDKAYPTERGLVPGNGAFAGLIELATGVSPFYIGKPSVPMLETLADRHGLKKEEMIMVGDNYETDIMAGIRFGIETVHVDTGVTRTEDLAKFGEQPTYALRTLDGWTEN